MIFFSKLFQAILRRKDVEEGFTSLQREFLKDEITIQMYNAKSEGYIDIREVFKTTKEQDEALLEHFGAFKSGDFDETALKVAKHVNGMMNYVTDSANFGKPEYWQNPYEVFKLRQDDCDGYAVLILKIWELLGIPSSRRMVWVGDVFNPTTGKFAGAHAVPIYLSYAFNDWFPIEGSFFARITNGKFNTIPLLENSTYGRSWFVTNEVQTYKGGRF